MYFSTSTLSGLVACAVASRARGGRANQRGRGRCRASPVARRGSRLLSACGVAGAFFQVIIFLYQYDYEAEAMTYESRLSSHSHFDVRPRDTRLT